MNVTITASDSFPLCTLLAITRATGGGGGEIIFINLTFRLLDDGAPVFWSSASGQLFPEDTFSQPDVTE